MTTITKLTKEQLIEEVKRKIAVAERYPNSDVARIEVEIFKIALASLEVAPVDEVSEKRHGLVMDGIVDLGGEYTYRIIKG